MVTPDKRIPTTISEQAAQFIDTMEASPIAAESVDDWRAWQAGYSATVDVAVEPAKRQYPATISSVEINGIQHKKIVPANATAENMDKLILFFHGGGFVIGSPEITLPIALQAAHHLQTPILSVRYPLAWQAAYPSALECALTVYDFVLLEHVPKQVGLLGDSAGGNLAAALAPAVQARDGSGLAAIALMSPWMDLGATGDSITLLNGADIMLSYDLNLRQSAELYIGNTPITDAGVSPTCGDFSKGFPPCFIATGTRDLFQSHCARLQTALLKADIEVDLLLAEGMWHVYHVFPIPEADLAWARFSAFFRRHLKLN